MTIAQVKSARRRIVNDDRWKPKKGNRMSKSIKRAMAKQRRNPLRSIGFNK